MASGREPGAARRGAQPGRTSEDGERWSDERTFDAAAQRFLSDAAALQRRLEERARRAGAAAALAGGAGRAALAVCTAVLLTA
ncbi:MAG: hypothetical protein R2755_00230 [Acidimicrobiales bacterium]